MRVIIEEDYQQLSKKAALLVASQVRLKPDSVLGLATGSTPLGMYDELIEMYNEDEINFSDVTTFNLDEYYQLPPDNPRSYNYYMQENFFKHININPDNTHIPDGTADDIQEEVQRYDRVIRKSGGIDMQVLGIGPNGHIGFNEPRGKLNVRTHMVNLSDETIEANSRFFESREQVPRQAITMGIATILKSDRILLLASGKNKAKVIKETISGYVSTAVPASVLQTHPEVTIIIDEAAASLI